MEDLQILLKESVENALEFKCFRHDFYNHVYVIKTYMEMGMIEESLNYINKLMEVTNDIGFKSITGNTEIDIILNNKISKFKSIGVEIDIVATLPEQIDIDVFDITALLGNVLDNAFEALLFAQEKRLQLDMNIVDDNLYINVANTHSNNILKVGDTILSTKTKDIDRHGYGLKSIKNSVDKYKGNVDITYDEDEFFVDISMPLKSVVHY